MANKSLLFTDFNAPDAEKPGGFHGSYTANQVEQALEREIQAVQRKIDEAREKFEDFKRVLEDRTESNQKLSDLLAGNPADYLSAIKFDLRDKPEEFEHLKDLLVKNKDEFVRQCEVKLEQERKDIRIAQIKGGSDMQKTSEALDKSMESVRKQKDYYENNPELYTKLYSIQQNAKAYDGEKEGDSISSEIIQSDKGELSLMVRQQMDGAPFFYAIRDGKVIFGDKPATEEQMKVFLDFMYVRGISNFELPPSVDENLKETYEKAQAARAEEANQRAQEEEKKRPYEDRKEEPAPENIVEAEMPSDAQAARTDNTSQVNATTEETPYGPGVDVQHETWLKNTKVKAPKEKNKTPYSQAIDEMTTWLNKSKGKRKGRSYFRHDSLLSGWTVFSVYPTENPDNYKLDGKRDSKGNINETYSYRIMIRPNKAGGIDVGYTMPKGGKVTDDVADKVVALQKSQGCKYIRFPKGLSDDDTGVFRMACARAGVIPRGISINEHHAKKMIDAASGCLSEQDLVEFKYRLALQMEVNMGGDPNGRQAGKVAELKGEYFFKPFKDNFDNILKPGLQKAIDGKEADKVIGASRAIQEIYGLYEKASQGNMGHMLNMMKPEDRQAFEASLAQSGVPLNLEADVRSMPKEYMETMFNVLSEKHSKDAKVGLEREFARRRAIDPETKSHDITKEMVADESAKLRQMGENLEKEHCVAGLRVPYLGVPHYDYSNDQSRNNSHSNDNGHHQQTRRGGNLR